MPQIVGMTVGVIHTHTHREGERDCKVVFVGEK